MLGQALAARCAGVTACCPCAARPRARGCDADDEPDDGDEEDDPPLVATTDRKSVV